MIVKHNQNCHPQCSLWTLLVGRRCRSNLKWSLLLYNAAWRTLSQMEGRVPYSFSTGLWWVRIASMLSQRSTPYRLRSCPSHETHSHSPRSCGPFTTGTSFRLGTVTSRNVRTILTRISQIPSHQTMFRIVWCWKEQLNIIISKQRKCESCPHGPMFHQECYCNALVAYILEARQRQGDEKHEHQYIEGRHELTTGDDWSTAFEKSSRSDNRWGPAQRGMRPGTRLPISCQEDSIPLH